MLAFSEPWINMALESTGKTDMSADKDKTNNERYRQLKFVSLAYMC